TTLRAVLLVRYNPGKTRRPRRLVSHSLGDGGAAAPRSRRREPPTAAVGTHAPNRVSSHTAFKRKHYSKTVHFPFDAIAVQSMRTSPSPWTSIRNFSPQTARPSR